MNKWEKIDLVRKLGLNTEENILIQSVEPDEISRLTNFVLRHKLSAVSIRTMSSDNMIKTPHYPLVKGEDVPSKIYSIIAENFSAIVATPIDPKDALLAGAVLKEDGKFYMEFARGRYTVRRVTHEGIIDISVIYDDFKETIDAPKKPNIDEWNLIEAIKAECLKIPFKKCVIELSYYNILVGYKKEHVIIWDISSNGTQESRSEIDNYYFNK